MGERKTGLLTTSEVADLFRVDSRTVIRWAKNNKLPSVKTMGGHFRFPSEPIYEALGK